VDFAHPFPDGRVAMLSLSMRFVCIAFFALPLAGCRVEPAPSNVTTEEAVGKSGECLFCHWNAEDFFDDKLDHRTFPADKEYDRWMAENPAVFELKLSRLTEALLKINNGCGPDILSICEVETVRAAELLKDALNKKLDEKLHYQNVLMKEVSTGRHIAPAIITRLPVVKDKTRLLDKKMRILEGHIIVSGHELVVFASHWTSRLGDGGEHQREHYADRIYGAFKAMYKSNPRVDVLICGDFNDTPHDVSVVKHLHCSGNLSDVKNSGDDPLLFNLFADKDPDKGFGTHYYNGKWFIFDQIVVSPGMLDTSGWRCQVDSVHTVNDLHKPGDAKKRPWRFGGQRDEGPRGYSDHFPVTVRLAVTGG
jgi:endonuclease/exonuclease/phosphatase family metal-dependent hydrolase